MHEALQTIQSILGPHLKSLSPDDRREMAKMGDKTIAFVVKALEYARKNPTLVPNYLDLAEFGKDVEGVVSLRNWEQTVTGAQSIYDDLSTRFPGAPAKKKA